jgi:hypothetical protein
MMDKQFHFDSNDYINSWKHPFGIENKTQLQQFETAGIDILRILTFPVAEVCVLCYLSAKKDPPKESTETIQGVAILKLKDEVKEDPESIPLKKEPGDFTVTFEAEKAIEETIEASDGLSEQEEVNIRKQIDLRRLAPFEILKVITHSTQKENNLLSNQEMDDLINLQEQDVILITLGNFIVTDRSKKGWLNQPPYFMEFKLGGEDTSEQLIISDERGHKYTFILEEE